MDASDLAGEELVVGETVTYNGKEVAVHRDINDTRQNDLIPKGSTTAIDTETGIKNTLAAENRVFKDTFAYEKLLPGETYRFTGKVMVKTGTDEDGSDILEETPSFMTDENGEPVANGYVEFTPEEPDGTLDLYFSIDASELADKDITVFEKVTLGGEPVIVHEVLDGSQTVYVPEGETTAVDSETRDQIGFPDEEVSVIDTFVYKNLIPGTEYTVRGRVMRKDTGEEIPSSLTRMARFPLHSCLTGQSWKVKTRSSSSVLITTAGKSSSTRISMMSPRQYISLQDTHWRKIPIRMTAR